MATLRQELAAQIAAHGKVFAFNQFFYSAEALPADEEISTLLLTDQVRTALTAQGAPGALPWLFKLILGGDEVDSTHPLPVAGPAQDAGPAWDPIQKSFASDEAIVILAAPDEGAQIVIDDLLVWSVEADNTVNFTDEADNGLFGLPAPKLPGLQITFRAGIRMPDGKGLKLLSNDGVITGLISLHVEPTRGTVG